MFTLFPLCSRMEVLENPAAIAQVFQDGVNERERMHLSKSFVLAGSPQLRNTGFQLISFRKRGTFF